MTLSTLSLSIVGATGRMGRAVIAAAAKDPQFKIVGGSASKNSPHAGKDMGLLAELAPLGVALESDPSLIFEKADVLIDFSSTHAIQKNLQLATQHQKPLVIGSTGHSAETKLEIETAAKQIPLLYSPNFTLGIALCLEACAFFARHLKGCFVDIVETHHPQKKDSPSGTALALAKALDFGTICPGTLVQHPRDPQTIAIHSIRAGQVVGEHRIIFECQGERIELKHEALSREAFAKGALRAAQFLATRSPGLYTMKDLLHA